MGWIKSIWGRPQEETPTERQRMIDQLHQVEKQLEQVESIYNLAQEDHLIEYCILERKALVARYSHLLRQIRLEQAPCPRPLARAGAGAPDSV